jgi:hypothetical protein
METYLLALFMERTAVEKIDKVCVTPTGVTLVLLLRGKIDLGNKPKRFAPCLCCVNRPLICESRRLTLRIRALDS